MKLLDLEFKTIPMIKKNNKLIFQIFKKLKSLNFFLSRKIES